MLLRYRSVYLCFPTGMLKNAGVSWENGSIDTDRCWQEQVQVIKSFAVRPAEESS